MLGLSQLNFDFSALPRWVPFRSVRDLTPAPPAASTDDAIIEGRDAELEEQTRALLLALDLPGGAKLVTVAWNSRLRSTAGYARYPGWAIELNPRLREFEGQVDRTLKHELAHLIAYHRSGRRRIEPHGKEWRQACVDLGIPDEKAHHRLPLPRNEVERKLTYACPACQTAVQRVRKFRRPTACLHCCNRHAGGRYDGRFRLVLVTQA
jgi:SprT protein